jgi:MFS family permease
MTSLPPHPHHERRRLILAVLGLAQLMVILDVTVVNIALPSAQDALGFSDGDRQWIVTAYALAFGGLLLLAGRVADLLGRKRTLVIGLVGFALASALGGAGQSFGMLVAARHDARLHRGRPRPAERVRRLQRRVAHPLLPLRVVLDRNRGGAFIALATNSAGLMAVFLFLTYYLQQNLGLSPAETGLAFLPSPIVVALASMQLAPRLAARLGARLPIAAGMALAALGMVLLAQLDAESSYLTGVVPGVVVMSLGLGCVMGLVIGTATFGADAGVAGATSTRCSRSAARSAARC